MKLSEQKEALKALYVQNWLDNIRIRGELDSNPELAYVKLLMNESSEIALRCSIVATDTTWIGEFQEAASLAMAEAMEH